MSRRAEKSPSLMRLCAKFLHAQPGRKFDVHELASQVLSSNQQHFLAKREKYERLHPGKSVAYQIEREIYARRGAFLEQHPEISIDASDKIQFFVPGAVVQEVRRSRRQPDFILVNDEGKDESYLKEADLYPALQGYFLDAEGIVSKRIRENTSSNKRGRNGNKWLHPDIAGMYVPGAKWQDLVFQCSAHLPTRKAKLISVEVKLRITSGDVRECFFQTVSNSLWANRAYLAASEIRGEDTRQELQTLCALHGVGYILIDPDDASASRIIVPAREREEVDWASVDRIAVENADFRDFLQSVLTYLKTGHVAPKLWDAVSN